MLLSPLTLPESVSRRRREGVERQSACPHRPAAPSQDSASTVKAVLIAWLALGTIVLLWVPAARGGGLLGASVPFWLVGAPLIDLTWILRRRWMPALRITVGSLLRRPSQRGNRSLRPVRRSGTATISR
ncbi:hypothetical protein [Dokdonella sp.]|uniref:hypothetical protein n=1 Tax=Dokdonella sp. TaxID=2291710 RepID=UPI001B2CC690|nr:hypothetical protein [Dokdonella sp.]MBO9664489.1 hypothetical protein [Dokdonella sp.]